MVAGGAEKAPIMKGMKRLLKLKNTINETKYSINQP